ncbi:MAG: hypothetical protein NC338_01900 [Firmicutes bacterium]|nr:hypothetical protein [Bacillota bacterium]MCM1401355.1 hypothetical protein [Bacteroides sp.]MCM1477380.1 hypothetical protein [Bacteroides sp.]
MSGKLATMLGMVCALLASATASAADSVSYRPQIHGTLRPRLEMTTEGPAAYHFQLRNARLSIGGFIAPQIDYFIQSDFCDKGSMKILDGWVRLAMAPGLKFQAGQFRMPFAVDPFRAPHNYLFANRSFIGRQMFNYRAVGAKLSYALPRIPLTLEAGAFNPGKIGDHGPWNRSVAFGSKATLKIGNVALEAGFASISPDSVRMNVVDGTVSWQSGRWSAEAEYMNKHYCGRNLKNAHAWNGWVDYRMPIKAGIFNRLSFQGRFDGMTAHSSGSRNATGVPVVNNPARNRITVGATISHVRSAGMYLDIRADYEKYFYHSNAVITPDMASKAILEMVLRF